MSLGVGSEYLRSYPISSLLSLLWVWRVIAIAIEMLNISKELSCLFTFIFCALVGESFRSPGPRVTESCELTCGC